MQSYALSTKHAKSTIMSLDIMSTLLNVLKPVVLYGAEMWGSENCDVFTLSVKGKVKVYLLVLYGQRPNVQQFYKLI